MDSSLLLALCIALSVFSCVKGAPTRAPGEMNFTDCRLLSIRLNEIARDLYNNVGFSNVTVDISDPPASIRQIDACDPWSLKTNRETCQSRIILALRNYTKIFHKDGVFKNSACHKWRAQASEIANVTGKLLHALKFDPKKHVVDGPLITVDWHDNALCRDSVERLYSFSIITARVFSYLASPVETTVESQQC